MWRYVRLSFCCKVVSVVFSFVLRAARDSTGTSLSEALERQPFSLVATRSYADSMLASYATISWFDDVIL